MLQIVVNGIVSQKLNAGLDDFSSGEVLVDDRVSDNLKSRLFSSELSCSGKGGVRSVMNFGDVLGEKLALPLSPIGSAFSFTKSRGSFSGMESLEGSGVCSEVVCRGSRVPSVLRDLKFCSEVRMIECCQEQGDVEDGWVGPSGCHGEKTSVFCLDIGLEVVDEKEEVITHESVDNVNLSSLAVAHVGGTRERVESCFGGLALSDEGGSKVSSEVLSNSRNIGNTRNLEMQIGKIVVLSDQVFVEDFVSNSESVADCDGNGFQMDGRLEGGDDPSVTVLDYRSSFSSQSVGNVKFVSDPVTSIRNALNTAGNVEMVRKVRFVLKSEGEGEIRLLLRPESLGVVHMKLNLDDGLVTGRILVESICVQTAFEQNMSDLRDVMKQEGFTLGNVEVSLDREFREYSSKEDKSNNQDEYLVDFFQKSENEGSGLTYTQSVIEGRFDRLGKVLVDLRA